MVERKEGRDDGWKDWLMSKRERMNGRNGKTEEGCVGRRVGRMKEDRIMEKRVERKRGSLKG
jgi:hypothetical protein